MYQRLSRLVALENVISWTLSKTYGGILDGAVQLVHFKGQHLVMVEGQRQSFHFGPGFDASAQLCVVQLYARWRENNRHVRRVGTTKKQIFVVFLLFL